MNENTNKSIIAKNIISFRKSLGLTQQELANITDLTLRTIAYYESGRYSIPLKNISKIASVLKVSISDLMESDHQKNSAIENLDIRWLKRIHEIKKLPVPDQKALIKYINMLIENNNKRKKKKQLTDSKK